MIYNMVCKKICFLRISFVGVTCLVGNYPLEFYNDFLNAIIMCYLIYRLNKDFKRDNLFKYFISCMVITIGTFLVYFLFPGMDSVVMLISNLLIITFAIKGFHNLSIYYSVLTAVFGVILIVLAELFVTLVYLFPQRLTSYDYRTSFIHLSIGNVLMFLFIFTLIRFIGDNFIKARKRIHNKYNKFTLLLAVNFTTVLTILIFISRIIDLYVDYKVVSDKLYTTYFSVIIVAIILILSIIFTLYFINYFVFSTLKYNRLKMISLMDSMTNTLNRGSGLRLIEEQLEISKKSNKDLTICYVDVNDLKVINDMLGHREGDQLIKAIVGTIKENIRETDAICRLGGDEFVIVFPGCNREYSENVMKRIADKVRNLQLFELDEFDFSISYGFSEFGGNLDITVDSLLDEADHQMYINKRAIKAMN